MVVSSYCLLHLLNIRPEGSTHDLYSHNTFRKCQESRGERHLMRKEAGEGAAFAVKPLKSRGFGSPNLLSVTYIGQAQALLPVCKYLAQGHGEVCKNWWTGQEQSLEGDKGVILSIIVPIVQMTKWMWFHDKIRIWPLAAIMKIPKKGKTSTPVFTPWIHQTCPFSARSFQALFMCIYLYFIH